MLRRLFALAEAVSMASTTSCPGSILYVPHGTVSHRHISFEGSLFFIKVNRDLSLPGRVASYQPLALPSEPSIDWSTKDPSTLPGPLPLGPKFVRHIGSWEGTYTHITKQGEVTDKHFCRLDIGIHGKYYSQRNTYTWKAEDGSVTKKEVYLFHGEFDKSGFCRIDSEKIVGWGTVIDAHDESSGSIIFYGSYKALSKPDTFDLIRMFNKEERRGWTWQVKLNDDLLKIVHVEEEHTRLENDMWIPRPVGVNQS